MCEETLLSLVLSCTNRQGQFVWNPSSISRKFSFTLHSDLSQNKGRGSLRQHSNHKLDCHLFVFHWNDIVRDFIRAHNDLNGSALSKWVIPEPLDVYIVYILKHFRSYEMHVVKYEIVKIKFLFRECEVKKSLILSIENISKQRVFIMPIKLTF